MPRARSIGAVSLFGVWLALLAGVAHGARAPRNFLISTDRTEPVVAIAPRDPNTVVIGTNTNYNLSVGGTFPVAYFTSHDGGRTFAGGTVPMPPGYVDGADPSVSIARSGTVFFAFLAETPAYCSAAGRSAVLLSTSTDGGRSFRMPTVIGVAEANDKPFSAIESVRGRKAHVFVTWTQFQGKTSRVVVARSLDGGARFGRAQPLFSSTWDNSGSVPLVGPAGRIYVLWSSVAFHGLSRSDPARILYRVSTDDGATFGPVHQIGRTFKSIPRMAEPNSMRNLTFPATAITADGTVFVAWSQVTRDEGGGRVWADIVVTRSTDGGRRWSSPRRANDVRRGDRFMPSLTAFDDSSVGLAFYDRRWGAWDLGVYAARMRWPGGAGAPRNVRVSARPAPAAGISYIRPGSTCLSPGRFFGDYMGTAATSGGRMLVTWADTQRRVPGSTDIWFATLRP